MSNIAAISATLSSIKKAIDIAKLLGEANHSVERAQFRLQLAELVEALADAKMQAVDDQQLLRQRETEIAELKNALETKEELVRKGDAYYRRSPLGEATGHPYCVRCWENDHRARQLIRKAADLNKQQCPTCKQDYQARSSLPLP